MHIKKASQEGFSLIEIIVFVTLVGIILVSAAGYTVRLVQNMAYNQHKIMATRYLEDMKEWVDGERAADWQLFQSKAATGAGAEYCVNDYLYLTSTFHDLIQPPDCPFTGVYGNVRPNIFQRKLVLIKDAEAANSVTAVMTVSWYEDTTLYSERITSEYSLWQ